MYRTNAQSRVFEGILREYSIPYKLFGSISFYQRAEIKNIVAYLRILVNKQDDQALKRIINYPKRGIGATTIDKLSAIATAEGKPIWQKLNELHTLGGTFNAGTIAKLNKFANLIKDIDKAGEENDVKTLIDYILDKTGITREMSADKSPDGINRYQNVQEFINAVQDYIDNKEKEGEPAGLDTFLEEIALATDQDNEKNDKNTVTLMTIHASKGLEFKVVFIVGVEEGIFPGIRSITEPKLLEEERRLFYVAITRCEENLFISFAKKRMQWGRVRDANPSRFINELDTQFVNWQKIDDQKTDSFDNSQDFDNFAGANINFDSPKIDNQKTRKLEFIGKTEANKIVKKQTDETTGISVGMIVKHNKFGVGTVLQLEGTGANTKALVDFQAVGKKNLLLKFAKLNIVNN